MLEHLSVWNMRPTGPPEQPIRARGRWAADVRSNVVLSTVTKKLGKVADASTVKPPEGVRPEGKLFIIWKLI
jgi:hypothetical protein